MQDFTHQFIHQYKDIGAFGLDRQTDETSIKAMLQQFSDDTMMATLIPRLSDAELEALYLHLLKLVQNHLVGDEYHDVFLKQPHAH
ncbi:MAG: cytoplasmic protein [Deltaproteobacteria bacterium]|nr:MAG: cytoplasmic protein [Deltaproteobacteria bacterium]